MTALFAYDAEAQARADALAKCHLAHRACQSALEAVTKLQRRTHDADKRNTLGPAQDCLAAGSNLVDDVTQLLRDGRVILRRGLVGAPYHRATFVSVERPGEALSCELFIEADEAAILEAMLSRLSAAGEVAP